MEKSDKLHVPTCLSSRKESPVSTEYETGWPPRVGIDVSHAIGLPLNLVSRSSENIHYSKQFVVHNT